MKLRRPVFLPLVVLTWAIGLPLAHAVIPWAISLLGPRHGWVEGRPSLWHLPGLALVATAFLVMLWIMGMHLAAASETVKLEGTPTYLLRRGPYKFSRNPLFLAEMVVWLGWAIFFGSLPVFIAFLLLVLLLNLAVIRYEEPHLQARFGEAYLQYRREVPRWLGRAEQR